LGKNVYRISSSSITTPLLLAAAVSSVAATAAAAADEFQRLRANFYGDRFFFLLLFCSCPLRF